MAGVVAAETVAGVALYIIGTLFCGVGKGKGDGGGKEVAANGQEGGALWKPWQPWRCVCVDGIVCCCC